LIILGQRYFTEQKEKDQFAFFRMIDGNIVQVGYIAIGEKDARAVLGWLDGRTEPVPAIDDEKAGKVLDVMDALQLLRERLAFAAEPKA
jgi:hypothetical protein